MDNNKNVAQLLNSPSKYLINTLPSGAKSNWYYDHEEENVNKSNSSNQSEVFRRGWLEKQPPSRFSSRKPKWFVLKEGMLLSYEDEREIKSAGRVLYLANKTVSELTCVDGNALDSKKFYFQISPVELNSDGKSNSLSKNVDIFGVDSEKSRKKWMTAIMRSMYAKLGGGIFGASLDDTLAFERKRNPERIVPEIVEECVRFLQEHGLDSEGIFRQAGRKSSIRKLREKFNRGERPTLVVSASLPSTPSQSSSSQFPLSTGPLEEVDIHSAASLLKSYLLDLPEPIIPVEFYDEIMPIVTRKFLLDSDSSIDKISSCISNMPPNSYNLLRYICQFLIVVANNESLNKMSQKNLTTIFCNSILEPEDDDPALIQGTAENRAMAMTIMLTYFNRIFKDDWKKDTREVTRTKSKDSRLSKSWDDLSLEGDVSFEGSVKEGCSMKTPARNSKSIELLNSKKPSKDESEEEYSVLRNDKKRSSESSSSTISSFLEMLPRFGSSRKSGKEKSKNEQPDSSRSSVSSEHYQDMLLRTSQTSSSACLRRSSSVRDNITKDKIFLLNELHSSPAILNAFRNCPIFEGAIGVENQTEEKDHVTTFDLQYLIQVKPKSLPVDELIEHFYSLQENLASEHKKVHNLTKEHSKEVKRLMGDVEEQREGREQAVTRVVELQSQLENYFLKFGPLD